MIRMKQTIRDARVKRHSCFRINTERNTRSTWKLCSGHREQDERKHERSREQLLSVLGGEHHATEGRVWETRAEGFRETKKREEVRREKKKEREGRNRLWCQAIRRRDYSVIDAMRRLPEVLKETLLSHLWDEALIESSQVRANCVKWRPLIEVMKLPLLSSNGQEERMRKEGWRTSKGRRGRQ